MQPLFCTNLSRRERPPEMPRTESRNPWMPRNAMGLVPPAQLERRPPERTATARKTLGREQAME